MAQCFQSPCNFPNGWKILSQITSIFLWPYHIMSYRCPNNQPLFYSPWVVNIDPAQSRYWELFVSFADKTTFILKNKIILACLNLSRHFYQISKCLGVARAVMATPRCIFVVQNIVCHPPKFQFHQYITHNFTGVDLRNLDFMDSLWLVTIRP